MNDLPHIKTRCRQIGDQDLGAIAILLERGFPGRSRDYWTRGLISHGRLPPIADCPRYGFMLEAEGRAVGVILLIYQNITLEGVATLRCNLSSWFVDPDFRSQASLLIAMATRRRDVTYVNISPARHTWKTIEAQNFICYAEGQFFAIPALSRLMPQVRVRKIGEGGGPVLAEGDLLEKHAGFGCLSLVVSAGGEDFPFVFLPFRLNAGHMPTPCLQLIYGSAIEDFVRFAGPIGRFLLRRGILFVMLDAKGPVEGLVGYYRHRMSPKYYRGPNAPRLGDLAFTERVIYGP